MRGAKPLAFFKMIWGQFTRFCLGLCACELGFVWNFPHPGFTTAGLSNGECILLKSNNLH